jgi:hypothetical protein
LDKVKDREFKHEKSCKAITYWVERTFPRKIL